MVEPMDLGAARKLCGTWDKEDKECLEDYPQDCPMVKVCQEDAEKEED